jgi:predicted TIM-barrel enzyme
MRICRWLRCAIATITCVSSAGAARAGPASVIDIIPFLDSREQEQNSEPSLGVNPIDPTQIIAGAFGSDPFRRSSNINRSRDADMPGRIL